MRVKKTYCSKCGKTIKENYTLIQEGRGGHLDNHPDKSKRCGGKIVHI